MGLSIRPHIALGSGDVVVIMWRDVQRARRGDLIFDVRSWSLDACRGIMVTSGDGDKQTWVVEGRLSKLGEEIVAIQYLTATRPAPEKVVEQLFKLRKSPWLSYDTKVGNINPKK